MPVFVLVRRHVAPRHIDIAAAGNVDHDGLVEVAKQHFETLKPNGALYAFLKIDGITNSRSAAFEIVDKVGVGLAPGSAFGAGGELFLRACFLRDPVQIEDAAERLATYILNR